MRLLNHFILSEFDSPDSPGSGHDMQPSFLHKLDKAREIAGIPFIINSGIRTPDHNVSVGGKEDSAHLHGYAADISAIGSRDRFTIVNALLKAGFTRIGIGRVFIHVDNAPSKDSDVIWLY